MRTKKSLTNNFQAAISKTIKYICYARFKILFLFDFLIWSSKLFHLKGVQYIYEVTPTLMLHLHYILESRPANTFKKHFFLSYNYNNKVVSPPSIFSCFDFICLVNT